MTAGKVSVASALYLSDKISGARKRLKIKQEFLAGLLGCSRSYVSKLESGRVIPSVPFAEKLERALALRLGALTSVVRAIRLNEAALKRLAVDHARGGHLHDRDGCVHCDGHGNGRKAKRSVRKALA